MQALKPDLVILDEFQRFRSLLDVQTGGEAAELAHYFFNQSDAHVLLLSATPYKPFTYAEESATDTDHYADFLKTLEFVANSEDAVATVRAELETFRQAALSGEPVAAIRDRVQAELRKWITRTERPAGTQRVTTSASSTSKLSVQTEDFTGFVAMRRVANAVEGPLNVEYWKSSPYFLNFLSGYLVGDHVRANMKIPERRDQLMPLFRGAQRIARSDVEQFRQLDWANARMRALAAEVLDPGSWRLLQMPPSLPYHALGGPYESVDPKAITKQLIFSSWVSAPSAIASLLSYEVQRRIFTETGHQVNTPSSRATVSSRLDYRVVDERPASMSALALLWPQPRLASQTDPLDAARDHPHPLSVEHLVEWARERASASSRSPVRPAARIPHPTLYGTGSHRRELSGKGSSSLYSVRSHEPTWLRRSAAHLPSTGQRKDRAPSTCMWSRCSGPTAAGNRNQNRRLTWSRRVHFSVWEVQETSPRDRSVGCGARTTRSLNWVTGVQRRFSRQD